MKFRGGVCHKIGFKGGGAVEKIWFVREGHSKQLPKNVVMTTSLKVQNFQPQCSKTAFLGF